LPARQADAEVDKRLSDPGPDRAAGVLVLHETVGPREILGGLVVLGGIASLADRCRGAAG